VADGEKPGVDSRDEGKHMIHQTKHRGNKCSLRVAMLLRVACSCSSSSIRGLATPWTCFLHLSLSCVILIDSSTESPVHVLILFIQAVRGLSRLRAPAGIVPCIISFSRRLPCFLMV